MKEYWQGLKQDVADTWNSKNYSAYAPIYAWHNRLTYDQEHIDKYNENPWGLGVGKYIYKEKDLLEYKPDEIINLNRDEYIGFYTNEIKSKMKFFNSNNSKDLLSDFYYENIYIKADCGSGKSVFFKNIIKSVDKCIIVVHLNSIKEGVYKEVLEKEGK